MKLRWYRFLDTLQSAFRTKTKEISARRNYGERWRDYVRPGRRYTRVKAGAEFEDGPGLFSIRLEPGWEFGCPQCATYSIVSPTSMVIKWQIQGKPYKVNIIEEWEMIAADSVKRGYKPPAMPTAERANCPNCRYRPGAPE